MRGLFLFVTFLWVIPLASAQSTTQSYNLREQWRVLEKDKYVKYSGQKRNIIHFSLAKSDGGSNLIIFDRSEFSVFINGKLIKRSLDTIRWKTDVECGTRLRYGPSEDKLENRAGDGVSVSHVVTLTGLTPDTAYAYSVGTAKMVLKTDFFLT